MKLLRSGRKDEIRELASQYAGLARRTFQGYVDLDSIAEFLNIEVERTQLPAGMSGRVRFNEETDRWRISINMYDSIYRQKFTLAHEIGHVLLGHPNDEGLLRPLFSGHTNNLIEVEANYFASYLIMPQYLMLAILKSFPELEGFELMEPYEQDLVHEKISKRIQTRCGVSLKAAQCRAWGLLVKQS